MMSLFNLSNEELLTFFAVLVRYSVLFALLPIVGDRFVPTPVKILLALSVSLVAFPALVAHGQVQVGEAYVWGSTVLGLVSTIALEVLFGVSLGFVSRLSFDAINFGANLAGSFMGFSAASTYDPHQETQTQVVAEIQMAIAMLVFLAVDGHHLMLKAALDSYSIVGLGRAGIGQAFSQKLIEITGQVIRFGIQIAAPVAISIFTVNVAFGVMSKAMPQLNILVLSFAITAIVGLVVMLIGLPEFQGVASEVMARGVDWVEVMKRALAT